MSKLSRRGEKKARKIRETSETLYDILENSMLGNPIDENTL
ncbi:MAG TPA: hypothetical protein VKM96_05345 [Candidatus Bathyarchaeia archaeon]|nr:hypothetical protein [Candidatus Bathyarchaeia archaeon]